MERLKVLFVSRKWPPAVGGMEVYSVEISKDLANTPGIDLTIRKLPGRRDGRPPHPISIMIFFLGVAWHLATNRGHYDIVHFGDMAQIGLARLGRLLSRRTRNVIALHGLDVIYGRRSGVLPSIYKAYTRFARRGNSVDCYIANSRFTAQLLAEEGFAPVSVVPLGVRLANDGDREPIEAIGEERFLLFFGRIFRRKGPRWFAENVLPLLPPDVLLYVVGTVWQPDEGAFLQQNNRVRMFGAFPLDISLEQFETLKRRAIAIVMPNVNNQDGLDVEGFGLTALEAADHGAPLIAADLEGIQDAVMHGLTGFLEPAEDADAWAERVSMLIEWTPEQRREFSREAQRNLLQYYSWARVAQDTIEVYKRCLERT
jgi:phosphatidylinositol alpha-1,6-mannosyltransferase